MASLNETMAYLAGLFDGEGCVTYRQRSEHRKGKPKAYKFWCIRIEINMIDETTKVLKKEFELTVKDKLDEYVRGQIENKNNYIFIHQKDS